MKNLLRTGALSLIAAGLMALAPAVVAAPISFAITNASITPGTGYGVDTGKNPENGGTLLDVVFAALPFTTKAFSLAAIGDSHSFQIGTVNFQEPDTENGQGNLGIRDSETDGLDVTVRFTFTNPMGEMKEVLASGLATTGPISDDAEDFSLSWAPLEVLFDTNGLFKISLNALSFANNNEGAKALNASVTLLALPQLLPVISAPGQGDSSEAAAAVPEPASLALVGLGLAGLGALRRRQHKA